MRPRNAQGSGLHSPRTLRWRLLAFLLLPLFLPRATPLAEEGGEVLVAWRSPVVEVEARLPWLPADPELAARLRETALSALARFVAEAEAQRAALLAEGIETAGVPWDRRSRVEIRFAAPCCLSLLREITGYTGGAHGNTAFESLFWERERKAVVGLDALLDLAAAKPALDRALEEALRREKRRRGFPPTGDDRNIFGSPRAEADSVFTLVPGRRPGRAVGLLFHFPPYALGPYAEGSYRLFVPAARFAAHLRPRYRPLFADE